MAKTNTFTLRGKLWKYEGAAAWHFVTLPKAMSDRIKDKTTGLAGNFGVLKVVATIGKTSWDTSIFRDNKAGAYLLPVKAAVRKTEKLNAGDNLSITVTVDRRHLLII